MEVTIEITKFCPNKCKYCSTNASTEGEHLPFKDIEGFLTDVWVNNKITRINISGGEPLAHPDFYKILQTCYGFTGNVWIYTNALKQIIYNTDVIDEIEVHANVCLVPGKEVYLPKNADQIHLLKLIPQGRAESMNTGNFSVSGNLKGCNACSDCNHTLLQADGKIMDAPCKKDYE
jgi:molybdenum cofactor biosynthesis enzyme MoaA